MTEIVKNLSHTKILSSPVSYVEYIVLFSCSTCIYLMQSFTFLQFVFVIVETEGPRLFIKLQIAVMLSGSLCSVLVSR